jgi:hypothetical protein
MRLYRGLPLSGVGDFIASVSGSSGDYDITMDNGIVLEAYDETDTSLISNDAPAAGDLLVFGLRLDSRAATVANADVIPAEIAAYFFRPADQT